MGAKQFPITVNALDLRPQWAWQNNLATSFARSISLLAICGLLTLWFLVWYLVWFLAPLLATKALFWCFSFFVLFMAGARIFALLITIKDKPSRRAIVENIKWPTFTILVPLYQEAHMVSELVKNLLRTNYPHDLIDIVLVVEEDDIPTCLAVKRISAPSVRVFEVPPSLPRTKPKALNAAFSALPKSRAGDIITVYDAEDRPHPDQLKQAALAFTADPNIAAVQAPLGYFNDKENLLTALFGLEYAALFHVWNPALAKLGIPFTLGGTSNHIRRDILESCGGWDPHNVTEDADLSFRIHALNRKGHRLKIATITPPTQEEAVSNLKDWTSQRSRWLKGFMQTWRVHMRFQKYAPDGKKFSLQARITNLFALNITVGATLLAAFLHLPSLILMAIVYIGGTNDILPKSLPIIALYIGIAGYGAAVLTGIIGALRANKPHLVKYATLMPFYWLLYFWPALIASYEILFAPAYWRKTSHVGVSNPTIYKAGVKTDNPTLEPTKLPPI